MEGIIGLIAISGMTAFMFIGTPLLCSGLKSGNTQEIILGLICLLPVILMGIVVIVIGIMEKKPFYTIVSLVISSVVLSYMPIKNEIVRMILSFIPLCYALYICYKMYKVLLKNKNCNISDVGFGRIPLDTKKNVKKSR